MKSSHYLLAAATLVSFSCKKEKSITEPVKITQNETSFITPPLKGVTIPKEIITVSAEKEGNITFKNGEQLHIPANSFIDKNGNPIKGDVEISFRTFKDPLDFFLSGIPMEMDYKGENYQLESKTMFEINGSQNNTPIFINPDKKLKITTNTQNNDEAYKFIKVDTISKNWVLKEENRIIINKDSLINNERLKIEEELDLKKQREIAKIPQLVKPLKTNNKNYHFDIDAPDSNRFPELKALKNAIYEVHKSDKTYNPDDAKVLWNGYRLNRTNTKGVYTIEFYNSKRKVAYKVVPTLEGTDFKTAMKAYKKSEKNRIKKEREIQEKFNEIREKLLKKALKTQKTKGLLNSAFSISGFGVYNVDRLFKREGIEKHIKFTDVNGNKIETNYSIIYDSLNTIIKANTLVPVKLLNQENVKIWTIVDNKFAYTTLNAKEALKSKNKKITLQLKIINKKITTPKQLRDLLGL